MRVTNAWILIACVALVVPAMAAAPEQDQLRTQLQARLDEFAKAVVDHDMATIEQHIPEGFTFRDKGGTVHDRTSYLASIAERSTAIEGYQVKITLYSLSVEGDRVNGMITVDSTAEVRFPDGKSHKVEVNEITAVNWVREGEGLKVQSAKQMALTQKVDGQVVVGPRTEEPGAEPPRS